MLGTNKIISYKELELITESNQKLINLDSGTLPGFLVMGEKEDSRIFLENFFQSPKNINLSMKNYLLYLTIDILNNIASFLSENIGDTSELISELAYPDLIIEECTTVEKAVSVLTPIIKNTLALRGKIKGAYFEVMLKAMKEIEKSYNNPKFSLISIASFCGMSPAHFSTVFKQNLEECFIKYLTNFRIDKAKTLLKTTNLRSSEIAFKVGYRDAHYFSFAFKKNVGITPIEFRDSSV